MKFEFDKMDIAAILLSSAAAIFGFVNEVRKYNKKLNEIEGVVDVQDSDSDEDEE